MWVSVVECIGVQKKNFHVKQHSFPSGLPSNGLVVACLLTEHVSPRMTGVCYARPRVLA